MRWAVRAGQGAARAAIVHDVRNPTPCQAAALAALADQAYLQEVRERVRAGRATLCEIARAHGMTPLPSATSEGRRRGPRATRSVIRKRGVRAVCVLGRERHN
eukprot:5436975-Prymnesium_polylepis.1